MSEKRRFLIKWGLIYSACLVFSISIGSIVAPYLMNGEVDYPMIRLGITVVLALAIGFLIALKAWKNYCRQNNLK